MIKNPQANSILECVHRVIMGILCTTEVDMNGTVTEEHTSEFIADASWAICSTYHTVLKASPGSAIFGRDMLFDIPYIADWYKIGEFRQKQMSINTDRENSHRCDFDHVVGG